MVQYTVPFDHIKDTVDATTKRRDSNERFQKLKFVMLDEFVLQVMLLHLHSPVLKMKLP